MAKFILMSSNTFNLSKPKIFVHLVKKLIKGKIQRFFLTAMIKINTLPDDKILDKSNLKDSADDKINATFVKSFVLERVENIVGKGGNASYTHFLLFPQCFQKASLSGSLKVRIVWKRVKLCGIYLRRFDLFCPFVYSRLNNKILSLCL